VKDLPHGFDLGFGWWGKGDWGSLHGLGVKDGCGSQVGWGREDVWEEGGGRNAARWARVMEGALEQVICEGKTTKSIRSMMDDQKLLTHSGLKWA
jgi:hypothetical protein